MIVLISVKNAISNLKIGRAVIDNIVFTSHRTGNFKTTNGRYELPVLGLAKVLFPVLGLVCFFGQWPFSAIVPNKFIFMLIITLCASNSPEIACISEIVEGQTEWLSSYFGV